MPATIPMTAVTAARALFDQGQYAQAWNTLAQAGDRYADNAAGVLGLGKDAADTFFQKLVEHHWENTVGADAYRDKFNDVAGGHLDNYLRELNRSGGLLPDTQFIIRSYEQALVNNGLDKSAAFDGAWAKAIPGDTFDSTWGIPFLGMEPSRMTTSETTNNLTQPEASRLLGTALLQAFGDMATSGQWSNLLESFAARFGTGVGDYFGDVLGALGSFNVDGVPLFRSGWPTVDLIVNLWYQKALNWTWPRDPLVLDLDGDGIEATAIDAVAPVLFDHDANGIKTATGWIKADDGIVVLDLNGNGLIDTGRELFGDNTLLADGTALAANGFAAIAQHDANADGKINSADAVYSQLRIWQDANQDGVSQASELHTLAELGIASINVTGTASSITLGNGNSQPWSGRLMSGILVGACRTPFRNLAWPHQYEFGRPNAH